MISYYRLHSARPHWTLSFSKSSTVIYILPFIVRILCTKTKTKQVLYIYSSTFKTAIKTNIFILVVQIRRFKLKTTLLYIGEAGLLPQPIWLQGPCSFHGNTLASITYNEVSFISVSLVHGTRGEILGTQ